MAKLTDSSPLAWPHLKAQSVQLAHQLVYDTSQGSKLKAKAKAKKKVKEREPSCNKRKRKLPQWVIRDYY